MKTLLTENNRDYIIEETTIHMLNESGKIDYTDEANKLANYKGKISSIWFYEDEYDENGRTGKASKVLLDVDSIKKLYDLIIQIENKRTVEAYYPTYY